MRPVVNVPDVSALEQEIAKNGVSLAELMKRAGTQVAEVAIEVSSGGPFVIFCGSGNNGGDGWVAADVLASKGFEVTLIASKHPKEISSDIAREAALRAENLGLPILINPTSKEISDVLQDADVAIDAMLGTGAHGEPRKPYNMWIEMLLSFPEIVVVAVDSPSGLNAQTGEVATSSIIAEVTVTMITLKPGLISGSSDEVVGELILAPLVDAGDLVAKHAFAYTLEPDDYFDVIPPLSPVANKFSRGSVLVVAGSTMYPGAAVLSAKAAARSGAGYVKLAVPEPIVSICQTKLDSIPVIPIEMDEDGNLTDIAREDLMDLAENVDTTIVGPGIGRNKTAKQILTVLLHAETPLVIDADGLDALIKLAEGSIIDDPELLKRSYPTILTPHPGELAKLMGDASPYDFTRLSDRVHASEEICHAFESSNLVVVSKGPRTVCVSYNDALIPKPGPAALATAGTGDVLSGVIGSLLAQDAGNPPDLNLCVSAAVEVHGMSGWRALKQVGEHGLIATDLIDVLGLVLDEFEQISLNPIL